MSPSPLAIKIIRAREKLGMTRADLWRKSGVPYTTLRNIETSDHTVKTDEENLQRIAEALEVPFDELRILAGYLLDASPTEEQRERRIAAQLATHPHLSRALDTLLRRNNPKEIDKAATYLEWQNQQEHE